MMHRSAGLSIGAGLLLTACATIPTGPSVMVLPGNGKSFEVFQTDDAVCRQWAAQQTGTTTHRASTESTVSGAAVGTAVGAVVGAAVGAAAGRPGTGAAVGAGVGLLGGTAVGASNTGPAHRSVQRRYDVAYMQCMYAKGNQIPMARGAQPAYTTPHAATPAPAGVLLPPPGTPPPPPSSGPPPPPPAPMR